jgi:phosphoheptose isomerase
VDYYQIIAERFQGTMENVAMSVDQLADPIGQASEYMSAVLLQDRKIIACGNGVDAALAQLFSTSLLGYLDDERPALPALNLSADGASLTATASIEGLRQSYSRQIRALGQAGDLLLLINSGSEDLAGAVEAALERNMPVVLLSNRNDTTLPPLVDGNGVTISVDSGSRSQVVEIHTMVLQTLCQLIEITLFGPRD